MREYFQSPRRQFGSLLLLITLILIGAWMRSAVMTDALEINGAYRIYSAVGQVGFVISTPKTVFNMIDWKHEPVPAEHQSVLALPYISTRWLSLPYWCFTIPIAGTSILFLMSKREDPTGVSVPQEPWSARNKKRKGKSR